MKEKLLKVNDIVYCLSIDLDSGATQVSRAVVCVSNYDDRGNYEYVLKSEDSDTYWIVHNDAFVDYKKYKEKPGINYWFFFLNEDNACDFIIPHDKYAVTDIFWEEGADGYLPGGSIIDVPHVITCHGHDMEYMIYKYISNWLKKKYGFYCHECKYHKITNNTKNEQNQSSNEN